MADSTKVGSPGVEKVRSQLLKEIEALAGPIEDLELQDNTVLLSKAICRIPGPLPNHAPSIKPMSELTKCPGIPPLYPQQGYRLTGQYLLLRLIRVTTDTKLAESGNFGTWVEDEAGVISPMALWNCHLPPEESEESKQGPFITPPISFGKVFPPVIMIKEPFVYGSRGGCTGIWVLHWTSDLVWVHADLPKHWRLDEEADFWIEKATGIAATDPTKVVRKHRDMACLVEVLTLDQALRFDLSDTRDDGEELWFQFTKARAERLALLRFHEEALFGLLQSWPSNRSTEIAPAQEEKGKGKGKKKKENVTQPLERCALRHHDRALAAFFQPAQRTRVESPRCQNLAALARQFCLDSDILAVDAEHAFMIIQMLSSLGHFGLAKEICSRISPRDLKISSKRAEEFELNLLVQAEQQNSPDAVLTLRMSPAKTSTKMGVYRKPVRVQRLKEGYRLVTNRAVKAGDCLLYERAMVCCQAKIPIPADAKHPIEARVDLEVAHRYLSSSLLVYIFHSPSSAAQLAKFSLEKTGEPTVDPRLILDGRPVIDGRLVERIVRQKMIHGFIISPRPDMPSRLEAKLVGGVWFMASFINRDPSAVSNVKMEITDNVLKVDALQDLPKGTELIAPQQATTRDLREKDSGEAESWEEVQDMLVKDILRRMKVIVRPPASGSSAAGSVVRWQC